MEPEDAIVAVVEHVHDPGFGGYDFVFVDELSLGQTCSVCLVAMRDPVQTTCGHRFCEDCLLGTFRWCVYFVHATHLWVLNDRFYVLHQPPALVRFFCKLNENKSGRCFYPFCNKAWNLKYQLLYLLYGTSLTRELVCRKQTSFWRGLFLFSSVIQLR